MTVIINPGSHIPPNIPNTYERAQAYAQEWLEKMIKEGFGDIEMVSTGECHEGRWTFIFRHLVTRVQVRLDQHGIESTEDFICPPRVYWNGSSSSSPQIDDFAAKGYVMTYRKVES
jgi:hypothetical protein